MYFCNESIPPFCFAFFYPMPFKKSQVFPSYLKVVRPPFRHTNCPCHACLHQNDSLTPLSRPFSKQVQGGGCRPSPTRQHPPPRSFRQHLPFPFFESLIDSCSILQEKYVIFPKEQFPPALYILFFSQIRNSPLIIHHPQHPNSDSLFFEGCRRSPYLLMERTPVDPSLFLFWLPIFPLFLPTKMFLGPRFVDKGVSSFSFNLNVPFTSPAISLADTSQVSSDFTAFP